MSSSCFPEPPSDCDNNTSDDCQAATSGAARFALLTSQDSERQLQLARLSRLISTTPPADQCDALPIEGQRIDLAAGSSCHERNNALSDLNDRPTAKQKRMARVVMAVAFLLLAMCFVLIVVTLSMSDHIDRMVREALLRSLSKARAQSSSRFTSAAQQQWNSGTTKAAVNDH